MTDFEKAMKELASVEHSNDNSKVLHKNSTELGLTFWGIYQSANPNLPIWNIIDRYLMIEPDIKKCGVILCNNKEIMTQVYKFYRETYWEFMRLDEFDDYRKKLEVFIFAVNVWRTNAVKQLQKMLGFTGKEIDGSIGKNTLARVNTYDVEKFNVEFDKFEIAYYNSLADNDPVKVRYLKGWTARALKY